MGRITRIDALKADSTTQYFLKGENGSPTGTVAFTCIGKNIIGEGRYSIAFENVDGGGTNFFGTDDSEGNLVLMKDNNPIYIYDTIQMGGRRKKRRSTKKARRNRRRYSRKN